MDRMHLMTVFIAVGEEQNFAAAARRLGLSPPTITRAIVQLEDVVGVKLVLRTTRSVRLTEAGNRYLEDMRAIVEKIAEANDAAAGIDTTPQGHLNVTASVLFGAAFVTPCIAAYLAKFPQMTVSAYFLDRVVNFVDEGMDVAVRIGHAPDASLHAVRVGEVRPVLCASPQYLASAGMPRHPNDLASHTIIAATGISPTAEWPFDADGEKLAVGMAPRLTVASNDAAVEAALLGIGIARLLSYQVAAHIAEGRLVAVLEDYAAAPWPVHVLHRKDRRGVPKTREFIDMLVRSLRGNRYLN